MKTLLLSTLVVLFLQSSCISQEKSSQRKYSKINETVKMQAFFLENNVEMGDTIVMRVRITNNGDSAEIIYKDAVLAIYKQSHDAFGESLNVLKWANTLLHDKILLKGETLVFDVSVPIEFPVFYKGKTKEIYLKYIVSHGNIIDQIECQLEEINVL